MKSTPNKNRVKFNRNKIKEPTSIEPQVKTLMTSSIILWVISLPMIGFYADTTYFGLFILMLIPLAWIGLPAGLAVYANLFYWWAGFVLSTEKKPDFSTLLMIGLASLTFFLRGVPLGSGGTATVYAWGYGAFVWGFAIILMAGAVWDTRPFYSIKRTLAPYFITFLVILLALFGLKYWQWSNANIYEREDYFPNKQVAFGVFTPSGIHYENQPFPKELPNNHQLIEIKTDNTIDLSEHREFNVTFGEPQLRLHHQIIKLPNQFLYQGYKISKADNFYIIEKSDIQPIYSYHIQTINSEKIRLSLHDIKQQREIWYSEMNPNRHIDIFKNQLNSLFHQPQYPIPKTTFVQEYNFTDHCPIEPFPKELNQGDTKYLQVDNKLIPVRSDDKKLFCQNNNMALIEYLHGSLYVNIIQRDNFVKLLSTNILIRDHSELQALYDVNKSKSEFLTYIYSAHLTKDGILLRHKNGETLLPIKK